MSSATPELPVYPPLRGVDLAWTRAHVPLGLYIDYSGDTYEVVGYAMQSTEGQRKRPLVLYRSERYSWTSARETHDFLAWQTTSIGNVRPRFLHVGPPPSRSWFSRMRLRLSRWRGSSRS